MILIEQPDGSYIRHSPRYRGFGTILHKVIRRYTGIMPCGKCSGEIGRLNMMSLDDIFEDKNNIVNGIIQRGKEKMSSWYLGWSADLLEHQIRTKVESWFDEAVSSFQAQNGV